MNKAPLTSLTQSLSRDQVAQLALNVWSGENRAPFNRFVSEHVEFFSHHDNRWLVMCLAAQKNMTDLFIYRLNSENKAPPNYIKKIIKFAITNQNEKIFRKTLDFCERHECSIPGLALELAVLKKQWGMVDDLLNSSLSPDWFSKKSIAIALHGASSQQSMEMIFKIMSHPKVSDDDLCLFLVDLFKGSDKKLHEFEEAIKRHPNLKEKFAQSGAILKACQKQASRQALLSDFASHSSTKNAQFFSNAAIFWQPFNTNDFLLSQGEPTPVSDFVWRVAPVGQAADQIIEHLIEPLANERNRFRESVETQKKSSRQIVHLLNAITQFPNPSPLLLDTLWKTEVAPHLGSFFERYFLPTNKDGTLILPGRTTFKEKAKDINDFCEKTLHLWSSDDKKQVIELIKKFNFSSQLLSHSPILQKIALEQELGEGNCSSRPTKKM